MNPRCLTYLLDPDIHLTNHVRKIKWYYHQAIWRSYDFGEFSEQ